MIGGGEARRTRADDQNLLAAAFGRRREGPGFFDREIAEEALDRINADGFVERRAIARASRKDDSTRVP